MHIIAYFVDNSLTVRILKAFPDILTVILLFSYFFCICLLPLELEPPHISYLLISDHIFSAIPLCIITNLHSSKGPITFLVSEVIPQYVLISADLKLDASGKKEHAILLFLCLSCLIKATRASKKQGSLRQRGKKDCNNKRTRKFDVIFCLLVMSECTPIQPHKRGYLNMSWTRTRSVEKPKWTGKDHESSNPLKEL